MDKDEIVDFLWWYWMEVDGKPYGSIKAEEVADWYKEYIEQKKKKS